MTEQTTKRTAYTPGPLSVGYYLPTNHFRSIMEHVCVMRADGTPVAICGPSADPQSEADARLIAKAPELVKALRGLTDAIGEQNDTEPNSRAEFAAFEKVVARQSIARALLAEIGG